MDFAEAARRFRFLEDQRTRGVLTDAQYHAELNLLRVTDAQGRLWMPQERTGRWHVYQNGRWVAAQPPGVVPPPPPPPANVPPGHGVVRPVSTQPPRGQAGRSQPVPAGEKGGGCGKFLLYLVLWFVAWLVIAAAVFIFIGQKEPMVLVGVGAAAFFSLVLMLISLSSSWSGTIVDIRMERVRVSSNDEDYDRYDDVRFAYVRRANGRTKRMRAMPNWQVGDRLVKRRGEAQIRRYPRQ